MVRFSVRARNNTSCSARRWVSASTSIGSRPSNSRHEALCEASMRPRRSLWASTLPTSKCQRLGTSAGPSFRRSSSMSVCGDAWSANNHEAVIEQSSTNMLTGGLRPAIPANPAPASSSREDSATRQWPRPLALVLHDPRERAVRLERHACKSALHHPARPHPAALRGASSPRTTLLLALPSFFRKWLKTSLSNQIVWLGASLFSRCQVLR